MHVRTRDIILIKRMKLKKVWTIDLRDLRFLFMFLLSYKQVVR